MRTAHPFTMFKTATLLFGALVLPLASCTVEMDQENVSDTHMSFEEFEAQTYREPDTGIYIVDGDIPIKGREKLKAFYEQYLQGNALIVQTNGSSDDKWSNTAKLNLTYCVSTGFGNNYNAVVQAMEAATAAWEASAYVKYVHVSSLDSSCNASTNVVFDVRPTSGQSYLARAFFPSDSRSDRNILIDSTSFGTTTPYTLTGILRHELGHTLGFRHEHIRLSQTGSCSEGSDWRSLTSYDAFSVMHYPQCSGSNVGDLVLTGPDKEGATVLYGAPYALRTVDVNGGGRADLVWNYRGSINRTYVARSNGNGTFTRTQTAWTQPESNWGSYDLHTADVDNDNRADLVWNSLGAINRTYVALGNPNGTFTRIQNSFDQPEPNWGNFDLHIADVDNINGDDLVWNFRGPINRTYVALSNGDGTFTRALTNWNQPEANWSGYTLSTIDVDGDDMADLVWNSLGAVNRTYVALSNGNGTFTRSLTNWTQPESNWNGYTLHTGYVNNDDRVDLIWNLRGTINRTYVALANPDGTFTRVQAAWDQPESNWGSYTLHVAYVNNDNRADLVWSSLGTTNRTYVALSDGDGTFTRLSAFDQPEQGWGGYTLHVADVNNDTWADLVWNSLGTINRTYVAHSDGDGTFTRALTAWDQPEQGWGN